MKQRIAVLAWGSLVWDPRNLNTRTDWFKDGPELPIEFARISDNGRLTLVIKPGFRPVRVFHAESGFSNLEEARENLRLREGTSRADNIGFLDFNTGRHSIRRWQSGMMQELSSWGEKRGYDAVIWTDIGPRFSDRINRPFRFFEITRYLDSLEGESWSRAAAYIQRTPAEIKTEYRRALEDYVDQRLDDEQRARQEELEAEQARSASFPIPVDRAVSLEDLPHILEHEGSLEELAMSGAEVLVDGHLVRALTHHVYSWSERILIWPVQGELPAHMNPDSEGGYFQTKYFDMETPGVLEWGGGKPLCLQWP